MVKVGVLEALDSCQGVGGIAIKNDGLCDGKATVNDQEYCRSAVVLT
jgi:hypothetical protein